MITAETESGPFKEHCVFHFLEQPARVCGFTFRWVVAEDIGVADVPGPGDQGLEWGPQGGDASDAEGAKGGAVIGKAPRDSLVSPLVTAQPVILAGHLERSFYRLRSAGGEEHPVQGLGSQAC